jgi:holo-[acyl-carrier protein] synthase
VLGVGIDIVEVSEVEAALRAHPGRYVDRVYTPAEQRAGRRADGNPDPHVLAALFAAKEAAIKALRPAGEAVPWLSIEIQADCRGFTLSGAAELLARERGVAQLSLDLTRTRHYAAAVVLACGGESAVARAGNAEILA